MTFSWSGGANFGGTFASNFSIDTLVVPAGNALGNAATIFVAVGLTATPGTHINVFTGLHLIWVDSLSATNDFGPVNAVAGSAIPLLPLRGGLSTNLTDRLFVLNGFSSLNNGGHWRITGTITGSETILGTIVSAIWDGSGTNPRVVANANNIGTSGTFVPESQFAGISYLDDIFSSGGAADSSPANAPDFTGSVDWQNTIVRANGAAYAGIGLYTGTIDLGDHPWSVSLTASTDGAFQNIIWGIAVDVPIAQSRGFITVVG